MKLELGKIDWPLLAQQKNCLLTLIWKQPHSPLWGLAALLDRIQDEAEHQGLWPPQHKRPLRTRRPGRR